MVHRAGAAEYREVGGIPLIQHTDWGPAEHVNPAWMDTQYGRVSYERWLHLERDRILNGPGGSDRLAVVEYATEGRQCALFVDNVCGR